MKHYLFVEKEGFTDDMHFHLVDSEHEQGSEEFEEMVESFQTNHNCIIFAELTEDKARDLADTAAQALRVCNMLPHSLD